MDGAAKSTVKSFCLSTSQHGFRFIYLEKRTVFEKCVWLIIIITCLISIVVYGWLIYLTYRDQINMVTTDTTNYPIWNYHFPAVTICNSNKISSKNLQKSLKLFNNFSGTEYDKQTLAKDLHHIYGIIYTVDKEPSSKLNMLQRVLDNNNISAKELFSTISPDCSLFVSCKLKGQVTRCSKIFKKILTVHGFCCSYNYFATESKLSEMKTPERVAQCSYKSALHILMNTNRNDYAAFDLHTTGFYVFIHDPYDYLDWSNEFIFLSQSSSNLISVRVSSIYTSDTLQSKSPKERGCYLSDEVNLDGFSVYTYSNCLLECRMRMVLKECKCVPFYYNFENGKENKCTLIDIPCLLKMKHQIVNSNPKLLRSCGCLVNCEHMDYNIAYSGAGISTASDYLVNHIGSSSDVTNHSVLKVYYNDFGFIRNLNDCQYNLPSLLAMLGGILGLFNGISILSLLEVTYFFTVRLVMNYRASQKVNTVKQLKKENIFTVRVNDEIDRFIYNPNRRANTVEVHWMP